MKYWETWFLTFGAGCMIGVVISPASWGAAFVGAGLTWIGWKIHQKRGEK
jgi:hypothetical protein